MSIFTVVVLAIIFDKLFSEPKRFHPLVGFGNLASFLESKLNSRSEVSRTNNRLRGLLAYFLSVMFGLVIVITFFSFVLGNILGAVLPIAVLEIVYQLVVPAFVLYLAIGWQSLITHARAISAPLSQGDIASARSAVAMVVSRDTESLDEQGVAKAATESVLENGADALFAAIFWFIVAGVPGVVIYRLSNTLDAMWGYKNERYVHFGWAAARIDDVLNYIPARLTAMTYALVGHTRLALSCWRKQASDWKSPNAGPVMAAGAGALNISLGGVAQYHSKSEQRPPLGPNEHDGLPPSAEGIEMSCQLVTRSLYLWLMVLMVYHFVTVPV